MGKEPEPKREQPQGVLAHPDLVPEPFKHWRPFGQPRYRSSILGEPIQAKKPIKQPTPKRIP